MKDKMFYIRTSEDDRSEIDELAELAKKKSQSEAVRLAIRFAILNAVTFRYWLATQHE